MITWKQLSEKMTDSGLLEGFDWSDCSGIDDIEVSQIPTDKILDIVFNYIDKKIDDEKHSVVISNIRHLSEIEKTIYCAYRYHLVQIMDGFFAVFTGFYSPLLFDIKNSLKEIDAKRNYELLQKAVDMINMYNKNETEFLIDIESESLGYLTEEETEEKYDIIIEDLNKEWNTIYWDNSESIEEKTRQYIARKFQLTIAST